MSSKTFHDRVKVEVRDQVAYVSMTRADKHNALDYPMFRGLVDAARSLKKDRSLRAVILSGEGPSFCSGLDVPSFAKDKIAALKIFTKYGVRSANLAQEAGWAWRRLPLPVLAVIHGRCYGGGMQIALGCDFRFADAKAELSIMEAKWGLVPDMSGSVTLRELLPMDVLMELAMTARIVTAQQARDLGLVTHVADDPLAAAEKLVAEIKLRSPDAVSGIKSLFHKTWNMSVRRAFGVESKLQMRMFATRNQREAAKANFEKRAPVYSDRKVDG